MILHGIEVTKFKWNDTEVSEEEYLHLEEQWKKLTEEAEQSSTENRSEKKSKKHKK